MLHLLRVSADVGTFAPIFDALRLEGRRAGWLELEEPPQAPPSLEAAAAAGALRAVAVGGGRSMAVKHVKGDFVLRDVLREHFKGCSLVLVRGELSLPLLLRRGESWEIRGSDPDMEGRRFQTSELVGLLRRPRPFERP